VSKKHGHRKKHRAKARKPPLCPRCHAPADGTPAALLGSLAAALSACEDAGMAVKFAHGAAITRQGYVLPLGEGQWAARTLLYTEFAGARALDDGDD
jgi:hypothetical protein